MMIARGSSRGRMQGVYFPLRWPATFEYNWYSAKKLFVVYWFWSKTSHEVEEFMLNAVKIVVRLVVP